MKINPLSVVLDERLCLKYKCFFVSGGVAIDSSGNQTSIALIYEDEFYHFQRLILEWSDQTGTVF